MRPGSVGLSLEWWVGSVDGLGAWGLPGYTSTANHTVWENAPQSQGSGQWERGRGDIVASPCWCKVYGISSSSASESE